MPFLASRAPACARASTATSSSARLDAGRSRAPTAPVLERALAPTEDRRCSSRRRLFAGSLALVPRIGFSLFPKAGTAAVPGRDRGRRGREPRRDRSRGALRRRRARAPPGDRRRRHHRRQGPPADLLQRRRRATSARTSPTCFAELRDARRRARSRASSTRSAAKLADYAGARIEVHEFENGPPLDAPIAFRLLGDDADGARGGRRRRRAGPDSTRPGRATCATRRASGAPICASAVDRDKAARARRGRRRTSIAPCGSRSAASSPASTATPAATRRTTSASPSPRARAGARAGHSARSIGSTCATHARRAVPLAQVANVVARALADRRSVTTTRSAASP